MAKLDVGSAVSGATHYDIQRFNPERQWKYGRMGESK